MRPRVGSPGRGLLVLPKRSPPQKMTNNFSAFMVMVAALIALGFVAHSLAGLFQ